VAFTRGRSMVAAAETDRSIPQEVSGEPKSLPNAYRPSEATERWLQQQQWNTTKSAVHPKLGTELTQLYQDHLLSQNDSVSGDAAAASSIAEEESIAVDITFTSAMDLTRATALLTPFGSNVEVLSCFGVQCSVRLPVARVSEIATLPQVHLLRRVQAMTHVGAVTSEGDGSLYANAARQRYAVTGAGLRIGVLSDSYNCGGGAATDISTGDLPASSNIRIVSDFNARECAAEGTDEGRAMMQLIHDVAPGASLAFRTAYRGAADFAAGILELAAAGCDILVDDIRYFTEPMFQDGIIAQAVDQVVTQQGIAYFSAAGNEARHSWVGAFVPSPNNPTVHQFGTDVRGAPISRLRMVLSGNSLWRDFILQWDEPFFSAGGGTGSRSDIDMYLVFNGVTVARGEDYNVGADPVEIFSFVPASVSGAATVTVDFVIRNQGGPAPKYMKLIVVGQVTSMDFATNSSTVFGHPNAAWAASVGAASYASTPAFGVSPPQIESFSSAGGTPILFSKTGTRLSQPVIRNQPRFTGPDGGVTTFFGRLVSGAYRFFGTSAAAPHVAAVAALMLQYKGGRRSLNVTAIYSTLATTAIDMDDPFTVGFDVGFDFGTGTGLVNASAALKALAPKTPVRAPVRVPVRAPVRAPMRAPVRTPVRAPVN
jgi:Subtilase family